MPRIADPRPNHSGLSFGRCLGRERPVSFPAFCKYKVSEDGDENIQRTADGHCQRQVCYRNENVAGQERAHASTDCIESVNLRMRMAGVFQVRAQGLSQKGEVSRPSGRSGNPMSNMEMKISIQMLLRPSNA